MMGYMQRNRFAQGVMKRFGYRLQAARTRKYRSAQQFAEKMGFDPHAYRKYERGETNPPLDTLVRICVDLDVTPNDLIEV
jgi:transcriptional regulator with XRE-family HTH domain